MVHCHKSALLDSRDVLRKQIMQAWHKGPYAMRCQAHGDTDVQPTPYSIGDVDQLFSLIDISTKLTKVQSRDARVPSNCQKPSIDTCHHAADVI